MDSPTPGFYARSGPGEAGPSSSSSFCRLNPRDRTGCSNQMEAPSPAVLVAHSPVCQGGAPNVGLASRPLYQAPLKFTEEGKQWKSICSYQSKKHTSWHQEHMLQNLLSIYPAMHTLPYSPPAPKFLPLKHIEMHNKITVWCFILEWRALFITLK